MAVNLLTAGEFARRPSILNRAWNQLFSQNGYLGNGSNFTGFLPVFNIHAYGAVGGGVADDTAAINNAISAANAAGGGVVTGRPGIQYKVSTSVSNYALLLKSNVVLHRLSLLTNVDVVLLRIAGVSNVLLDKLICDGGAVGTVNDLIQIAGNASEIKISRCLLNNARLNAVYVTQATRVEIVENHINSSRVSGIMVQNSVDDTLVAQNTVRNPGYKGIGVMGDVSICRNAQILGNRIVDAGQVSIECFGGAGPGVAGAVINDNIIQQSLSGNDNFGISLNSTTDATVSGNRVKGGDLAYEAADAAKGCLFVGNVSEGSKSGFAISGAGAERISFVHNMISNPTSPVNSAIDISSGINHNISHNTIKGGAYRGISLLSLPAGNNSVVMGNIVQGCAKSGIYVYQTGDLVLQGNIVTGNNLSAAGGENSGMYFNLSGAAQFNTIAYQGNIGPAEVSVWPTDTQTNVGMLRVGGFKKIDGASITNVSTAIAHGLGYQPVKMFIVPRGNAVIWRSAAPDTANVYLQASVAGPILVDIYVA